MGVRIACSRTDRSRPQRIAWVWASAAVACACVFAPVAAAPAFADEPEQVQQQQQNQAQQQPQNQAQPLELQLLAEAEAITTRTTVAVPVQSDHSIYLLGSSTRVSATVLALPEGEQLLSAQPAGTVDFHADGLLLGTATLEPGTAADSAVASITTDLWPTGGAYAVTATFTPASGSGLAASVSAAQTYRIVDTERIVPDIALAGDPQLDIVDGSLTWSIGNIWFGNFNVGFEREVVSGNVTLPELGLGTTIAERQEYYTRPFTFSAGSGQADAEGNRIIDYEGTARLTSGNGHQWNFSDPTVHISAAGDGYITAVFSGFYDIGGMQPYGPVRVTIATFTGASIEVDAHGAATAEIALNWEGQARGAGTWSQEHNASFPNEFVALLNPGISLFFTKSGVATDASKAPLPITLSFREVAVPVDPNPGGGGDGTDDDGTDGDGTDGDGTDSDDTTAGSSTTGGIGTSGASTGTGTLSTTGAASAPLLSGGIALVLLASGGALLVANRRLS